MSQFHVSQIETKVRSRFEDSHWTPDIDDVNNLSRLLALYAVHHLLGDVAEEAATLVEITDGSGDRGIDAVGLDPSGKTIILVQSKWRQNGRGSIGLGEVLKFLDGTRSLIGMSSGSEPIHASDELRTSVRNLLRTPGTKLVLVTATTASEPLSEDVSSPINDLLGELNDVDVEEPLAEHVHLGQARFFDSLTEKVGSSVELDLQMLDWGRATEPQRMFYGRVSARHIAQWYADHGTNLFAENIRVLIPRSDINEGILRTIADTPDQFLYFNNGITILASKITHGAAGAMTRDAGYFKLANASVVNGAQTVSTLGSAINGPHETGLESAYVLVRCIEVADEDIDLGRQITRFANTQNEVSSQDFAFLDPEQHRLVRELQVLGYEYILRTSEAPKGKDRTKVIELRQAAIALACASRSLSHAVTAKREVSRLFTDPKIYKELFNPTSDPLRLVRAVLITAKIDSVLDHLETTANGVTAGLAVHGRRVVAHKVMRELGDSFLAAPDSDVDGVLNAMEATVSRWINRMEIAFPANAYPGNLFKNQSRVSGLFT